MGNSKWSLLIAAAVSVESAAAAYISYKNATGDLADPSGWGGNLPSVSDDYACIDKSGPYTASDDLDWGCFCDYAVSAVIDFTATPERTVRLHHTDRLVTFMGDGQKLILKGGAWGFDNLKDMVVFSGDNSNTLVLSNSCNIVNAKTFILNQQNGTAYPNGNTLVIADGAGVSSVWARLGSSLCYSNRLEILSAGSLTIGGWFWLDNNASSRDNVIIVDGDGSKINLGDDEFRMGNQGYDNELLVRNGGAVVSPNGGAVMTIGATDGAHDNRARFESSSVLSVNAVNLKGFENTLSADASRFSVGSVSFGGRDNSFAATNTPVECTSLSLASASSHTGNSFIINGGSSVFALPVSSSPEGTDIYGKQGYGNTFSIENGASWSFAGNLRLMQDSSNNVFRVAGGASVSNPDGELTFGYSNPTNCTGNKVEITGGALTAKKILVQGTDNGIVVSNGTVRTSDSWGICLGYKYAALPAYDTTNCYLQVQGDAPRVELVDGNFRVTNGARLRFDIPECGYAENHVPVKVGWLTFSAGSKIEIECSRFVEKTGGKIQLLSVANSIIAPEGELQSIADSCSGLPDGCSLIVKAREIWLKTPSRKGLKVYVR